MLTWMTSANCRYKGQDVFCTLHNVLKGPAGAGSANKEPHSTAQMDYERGEASTRRRSERTARASEANDRRAATSRVNIKDGEDGSGKMDLLTSLSPAPNPAMAGQGFSADDLEMQDWEIAPGHISRRDGPVDRKLPLEATPEYRADISQTWPSPTPTSPRMKRRTLITAFRSASHGSCRVPSHGFQRAILGAGVRLRWARSVYPSTMNPNSSLGPTGSSRSDLERRARCPTGCTSTQRCISRPSLHTSEADWMGE